MEIQRLIEQTPLQDAPAQNALAKWLEINDSIRPTFISRREYEQRIKQGGGVLEKDNGSLQEKISIQNLTLWGEMKRAKGIAERYFPDEKQNGTSTLFLPTDLHLWEMVGIVETIDKDTFANKPQIWQEKKQEFQSLGKMFRNSAIYVAQRISSIQEGQSIGSNMVQEFFGYGNALTTGYMDPDQKELPIEKIALNPLNPEDTEQVDKWLAGDRLYNSRIARAQAEIARHKPEEADQIIENMRRSTLAQFFRAAINITQSSTYRSFLDKVEHNMQNEIEKPGREFYASIFRRGMQKLLNEIKTPKLHQLLISFFEDLNIPQVNSFTKADRKLTDVLQLDVAKKELQDIKRGGDAKAISKKEMEIVKKIQEVLTKYPFENLASKPFQMIENRTMNCAGRTMLAGMLLKEVGICYLPIILSQHAIIFIITADNKVFWEDMQMKWLSGELQNKDIKGKNNEGKNLTVADIVSFSRNPNNKSPLKFSFKSKLLQFRRLPVRESLSKSFDIKAYPPEVGEKIMLLDNLMWNPYLKKNYGETIEACILANSVNPGNLSEKAAIICNMAGNRLFYTKRYQKAIDAYKQAYLLDPKNPDSHINWGNTLRVLGKNQEALEKYQQASSTNPKAADPHWRLATLLQKMNSPQGAIKHYEQYLALANKKTDARYIGKSKRQIRKLQQRIR